MTEERRNFQESNSQMTDFESERADQKRRGVTAMRNKIQMISLIVFLALSPIVMAGSYSGKSQNGLSPLEDRVRHALATLPYYSVFDNLEFQVQGTNVMLSGQVVRPTLKKEAENAVRQVADIGEVENRIEVLPLSPSDEAIRLATYRAIYRIPSFTKYAIMAVPPIHIIVKNGDVTLVGAVSSQGEKNLVNIRANSVPGVFSVENELRVVRA